MKQLLPKIALFLFVLTFLFLPRMSFAAYVSDICSSDTAKCAEDKVGPFMMGISTECGNTGKCSLGDIMIVVENIGNFIFKTVGSLLLVFYVYGGFMYLISHGDSKLVEKGKTAIKTATIGFIIIMFAWLGVTSIKGWLTGESVANTPGETFADCSVAGSEGKVCGKNQVCETKACRDTCQISGGVCMGVVDPSKPPAGYSSCSENACPSAADSCCKK